MSQVVVFVATQKGGFVFRSNEAREEWSIEGPLMKSWTLFDMRLDQRGSDPTLWVAISAVGVLRTDDGELREHVLIYYNDESTKWFDDLNIPLKEGDKMTLLQSVTGG